jgi:hypothetical protein
MRYLAFGSSTHCLYSNLLIAGERVSGNRRAREQPTSTQAWVEEPLGFCSSPRKIGVLSDSGFVYLPGQPLAFCSFDSPASTL